MIPFGNYYGINGSSDNTSIISCSSPNNTAPVGSSSDSLLLDSVPGLQAGLAVEWTEEEQYRLEEALVKYKDEPRIMKYIKIAAHLRDKTVRDVALRCQWMMRKRRKQEESHLGQKGFYGKDKFGESSSKTNLPLASISDMNVTPCPPQPHQMVQTQPVNCKALTSKAMQLLEQNVQALNLINNNLTLLKLQDNIDLFCHTRDNINNITAIINDLRELSGKIGQMQELPISIDHNLADCFLPRTSYIHGGYSR